jgi:hypothetical protein
VRASDASEPAGLHELDHAPVVGQIVVNVVAHLGDSLVLQRGIRHHPSLGDAVAEGFFDEHVLPRFEGAHGGERMPVIGRDDRDGVDFGVFEDPAEVAEDLRLVPSCLLDLGDGAIGVRAIDVADRADPHVGMREELAKPAHALPADADHAQHDLIVRPLVREHAPVQRGHRSQSASYRPEECTPGDFRGRHRDSSFQHGRPIRCRDRHMRFVHRRVHDARTWQLL